MKDINLNFKDLPSKLLPRLQKISRYKTVIFITTVLIAYAFLVWRINSFNQAKPSDDAVTEKLKTVKLPKIDQSTVSKIQQLEDNSVDVEALFKHARENPFQE